MNFSNQKLNGELNFKELENLISNAIQKVGGNKENDLCKYLPVETGGYMHHFTLKKMKSEEPEKLFEMIDQFILKTKAPNKVPPKPRAARGSRKRRDQIVLTKSDLERMLNIARLAGDKEMINKLTPRKSLSQIKKDLISSIRQGKVEQELWNSYVEALNAQTNQLNDILPNASVFSNINGSNATLEIGNSLTP